MAYISGFCGNGWHEGTRPKSYTGLPMKVCAGLELCTCDCHKKIDKMYAMAGAERFPQQNPNYIPAEPVDLFWLEEFRTATDASPIGGVIARAPVEQPRDDAPGLVESTRTFTPTIDGGRARGQLEAQVLLQCNRYVLGEIGELMTPKLIGSLIDVENPPSSGAIGAVLHRWQRIGYANVKDHPIRFVGFTVQGMQLGLEKMKMKAKGR